MKYAKSTLERVRKKEDGAANENCAPKQKRPTKSTLIR